MNSVTISKCQSREDGSIGQKTLSFEMSIRLFATVSAWMFCSSWKKFFIWFALVSWRPLSLYKNGISMIKAYVLDTKTTNPKVKN